MYILQACSNCLRKFPRFFTTNAVIRQTQKIPEVNTNVVKDVILFKYDNPRLFKIMNMFAISQYVFWTYLAVTAQTTLKDIPVDEENLPPNARWYERMNLGDPTYRKALVGFSLFIGTLIMGGTWMYTLKSVRYLILNKGGQSVTFVTYAPFGENRMMKVDLKFVSCTRARTTAQLQLPIKVKNQMFHYMLDMRGEFRNPTLFDHTAGLMRNFN